MSSLWLIGALFCYAVSSAGFVMNRLWRRPRRASWAAMALGVGAAFQALDLVAQGIAAGNIPVTNLPQSLSFLAWLTALVGLVLIARMRVAVIGAFVAPGVTLVVGATAMAMRGGTFVLPQALRSAWLPIHVTLAFSGYALFVSAAVVSIAYLILAARLKSKRTMGPADEGAVSLEKLDRINYRLIGWGFVFLSLAIVTGAIWAESTWGRFWSWEPRESWSLALWILYAALLESRLTVGWRGRRAAAFTIAVFVVLVGSFLGVSLVSPGKHGGSFG